MSFESLLCFLLLLYLPISSILILDIGWMYYILHLACITYFILTVNTSPGSPFPLIDGSLNNCHLCCTPKPERTHHCSKCCKCILRMDHHCIWLDTCIGFYNIGHFTRFLLFVSCLSSWTLLRILYNLFTNSQCTLVEIVVQAVNTVILVPFTSIIFMMTWNQAYNLCRNYTVIEALDESLYNAFDLGLKYNLNETLGHYLVGWILPLKPRGNGFEFKKKIN